MNFHMSTTGIGRINILFPIIKPAKLSQTIAENGNNNAQINVYIVGPMPKLADLKTKKIIAAIMYDLIKYDGSTSLKTFFTNSTVHPPYNYLSILSALISIY